MLALLVLAACAQQVAPTGGKRDQSAPIVKSTLPENKSTSIFPENIVLNFDEYVQLKEPQKIIISPIPKEKPEFINNGRSIEVRFRPKSFETNKTYSINFGNSVADVHEGNVLRNLTFVFATGEILDSNRVFGKVVNSATQKPEKDMIVGLFKIMDPVRDTSFKNQQPLYYGTSNESGQFLIENLPADTFRLLSFKDANGDSKFQYTENAGFLDNTIIPGIIEDSVLISSFTPNTYKANALTDYISKEKGKVQLVIQSATGSNYKTGYKGNIIQQWKKGISNLDTLNLFLPNFQDTALQIKYHGPDSVKSLNFQQKQRFKYPELHYTLKLPQRSTDTLYLTSTIPVDSLIESRIHVKADSIEVKGKWKAVHPFQYYFQTTWKEGKNYQLTVEDSAIWDCFKRAVKKQSQTIQIKDVAQFGNLHLTLNYKGNQSLLVQLVQEGSEQKVVAEKDVNSGVKFWDILLLDPGNYQLRVIADKNKNGIWDTGNVANQIQPEVLRYFPLTISVKAYWDIEQQIDLNQLLLTY